jgi:4-hydroxyphenylpyruvate dioxygenase-like putative hemolysin
MFLAEMRAGPITFVLVQGDSERSHVSKYIERYGPGVQHVALEVDDLPALLDELGERGCDLLTGVIESPGLQQAFTKREPNSGVQLEFISRGAEEGFSQSNITELFEAMERENVY